jgi:para-aminobenzoate synthetase
MTGAPKLRSVELLERLEGRERGVYSGILGYHSWHGHLDFSVVIRSAVFQRRVRSTAGDETWSVSVGAGGAITILSDPQAEWEEVCTKLSPLWKTYVFSAFYFLNVAHLGAL